MKPLARTPACCRASARLRLTCLFLLAAGGGFGCGDDVAERRLDSADADSGAPDGCTASECRVAFDYGTLGTTPGSATQAITTGQVTWHASLDGDCASTDVLLWVEMIAGKGALVDGIEPGTYELQEDDLSRDTCGACIRMVADNRTTDARCYFATGGTLVLSEVEEKLVGQIHGVGFAPVACGDTPAVAPECSSEIDSLEFDSEYVFTD